MTTATNRLWPGLLRWFGWAAAVAFFIFCASAFAQLQDADPPGRVGRVSDVSGQVWLYSPDAGDWIAAVRNQPLTSGDRLAADAGGRAELQIGSTTLRLDSASELEVTVLDDQRVDLQLLSGSALVRVRSSESAAEFSLATADGRFRAAQPGRYRFDRLDDASAATAYEGQAVYEYERTALPVTPGQRAEFWVDAAGVAQYSLTPPARDAFLAWNDDLDSRDRAGAVSSRYASSEMTGVDDLDRYGSWEQTPEYGALWTPRGVAADWAPYSTGQWAIVRPWGWTWVDDAPWGFAPFHYGRWVYARRGWGWVPGVRVARPVYAPALVAWVDGSNPQRAFGPGGGPAVGWFPLGPRDVFVPGYHYSPRYVREINITHVNDPGRINAFVRLPPERRDFGNRRLPNALTVVPSNIVSGRLPVAAAAARMRGSPEVREFARVSEPGMALSQAPLIAPAGPLRSVDPRTTRPPGFPMRADRSERYDAGQRFGGRDQAGGRPAEGARPYAAPQAATPIESQFRPESGRPGRQDRFTPQPAVGINPANAAAAVAPAVPATQTPEQAVQERFSQPPGFDRRAPPFTQSSQRQRPQQPSSTPNFEPRAAGSIQTEEQRNAQGFAERRRMQVQPERPAAAQNLPANAPFDASPNARRMPHYQSEERRQPSPARPETAQPAEAPRPPMQAQPRPAEAPGGPPAPARRAEPAVHGRPMDNPRSQQQ